MEKKAPWMALGHSKMQRSGRKKAASKETERNNQGYTRITRKHYHHQEKGHFKKEGVINCIKCH